MGYVPLHITLTGFKGIRSGLGRDTLTLNLDATLGDAVLVAIAGANGRGKTTLMDNLTPHLVMPSRANADGLGAFSYYDHVYLPESQKELVWSHRGRRYKTHLVFRLNGKRKTEAYLFEASGGNWKPVVLADGTAVDGKVDTYERAVSEILGPPETFFTSVFSAQGKRPLSAYKNGEIKTLLADLLGLDEVREQGARAAEVVRLLKAGLGVIRQEQGQAAETLAKLDRQIQACAGSAGKVQAAQAAKEQAARRVEDAKTHAARLESDAQASADTEKRRADLSADRARAAREQREAVARLDEEDKRVAGRQAAVDQRAAARRQEHAERRRRLETQGKALREVAARAGRVAWACRREGAAAACVEARTGRLRVAQAEVAQVDALRVQMRLCRQEMEALDREAGQLALRQADLGRRFGLTAQVPCAGTDLQGRCQLLGDAREAQALIPSVEGQLSALGERKRQALENLSTITNQLERLAGACERRNRWEQRLEAAQARQNALALLAGKEGEVHQAVETLASIERELSALPAAVAGLTEDEAAESREIAMARQRLAQDGERCAAAQQQTFDRIDAALRALPAPFNQARLTQARQAADDATRSLREAEAEALEAVRLHEQRIGLQRQADAAREQQAATDARATRVERELGNWVLLAKCLSNDGVVALDIDDAGPTFSALANDLLLACYGPRFTLEVITQTETAKGELREDFDIIVHDGLRGEAKSLKLVSGGERTWIDACLTRAIALYLAGNTGRQFGTLFCDEADGPLDPEHKRMFMDMKREVLRLGNYAREFYVSQTPELTAMADRIIDLDALACQEAEVA
ncbi:DNA repair protein [uncultured Methylibium sp.]|uniref:DNA repair protein n=1 Tax=uncultured Methylibium sp. TaxID=381093 RepID=UPI0025FAB0BF|nr:DNA repair protein [uncultured Methylibium sp.]